MPDEQTAEDKAPYLSFTTLVHFLDRLGEGPVPPQVDKSTLETYSGGTQAVLLSTLRLMDFIDADGVVKPSLRKAVVSVDARKAHLEGWARHFYANQLALAEQNGTAQLLQETFAQYGYTGSTLRKAVVFYLGLVEYVELPNSPYFRAPKQSATATSRPRVRRATPASAGRPEPDPEPPPRAAAPTSARGETTVSSIKDLATITVTVDALWMKLPVETITSMREAIAKLEALDTSGQQS